MTRCLRPLLAAALLGLASIASAAAQSSLPDRSRTPGEVNPAVSQATIDATICLPGWTARVRPSRDFTDALKRRQIEQYGYADRRPSLYEEDHLIPIGLGGAPADPRNLWPEPRQPPDGWDSAKKDGLEAELYHLVCAHRVRLDEARQAIARNWHDAYNRFIGAGSPAGEAVATTPAAATVPRPISCPNDRMVWVNTRSGVYHFEGERWFGRTKAGRFMCQHDADREGDRPTHNGQ